MSYLQLIVLLTSVVTLSAAASHKPYSRYYGDILRGRCRVGDDPESYLHLHNVARAEVGVVPVSWDYDAAAYARNYSQQRKGDCSLVHSNSYDHGFGENIFVGTVNNAWSAVDAVGLWMAEKRYYDYKRNYCFGEECGHYTQIVWSRTQRVGCARVECHGGGVFITCNYSPPGNIIGEWPY